MNRTASPSQFAKSWLQRIFMQCADAAARTTPKSVTTPSRVLGHSFISTRKSRSIRAAVRARILIFPIWSDGKR